MRRPDRRALVYGEVTAVGARQLIRATGLHSGDCFVDLGSGVGKLVLYVALALPGVRARGIELDSQRSEAAQAVRARAVAEGLISADRCILEHADVRTADLAGSTVLFASSTCFPRRLLETIARRIAQLQPPSLFATLQPLQRPTARLFDPPTEARCATSWDHQTTVHLYRPPAHT